ncbi:MAG: phenylalanine--tRNA ligase subunit alpha [Rhodospirillaceae bacterium]
MDQLEQLREELLAEVASAADLQALDGVRVGALGKKGRITAMMKELGGMEPDARKAAGQALNVLKGEIATVLDARKAALEESEIAARLASETVDVSLPVRPSTEGLLHPISQTIEEVVEIFAPIGFEVAEGPDIEDDFHNFTALNFPPDHPAREMHDTFFLPPKADDTRHLLRTHTSPVQVRVMQDKEPPIRILAPGRTYRCDYDITHTPMFHQIEGLVIDKVVHMGHLKSCIIEFVKAYFELDELPTRFRPSYFPFTEPSAEVDIGCSRQNGELKIGAGADWLEILGCGMVHPNVLSASGIDPNEYKGFAFGLGVERIAMLKYGIPDLRTFYDSDLRWLRHYGFAALDVPTSAGGLSR